MTDFGPEATVREAVSSIGWIYGTALMAGLPFAMLLPDGLGAALGGAALGFATLLMMVLFQWWWGPV